MSLNWMDVSNIPFEALLLLERAQLRWFRFWNFPRPQICLALAANPHVTWFMRHKCPELSGWLDAALECAPGGFTPEAVRLAELAVLDSMQDLLIYALDPSIYDNQKFLAWNSRELTGLVDFQGKVVLDIGSGTGRLAFSAAPLARVVYAVEPVGNLRDYLREKAARLGFRCFYAVDGLITAIPFEDHFADIVMSGHVYGDEPDAEADELLRVTRPGGMVILCPGNNDVDNPAHAALIARGFAWSCFEEPGGEGLKRKYWKIKEG